MSVQITLDQAVGELREKLKSHETSPYFFLVGAGISIGSGDAPGVPLAPGIVERCREAATVKGRTVTVPASDAADRDFLAYARFIGEVFDDPEDRRRFFAEFIQPGGKPQKVTPANKLLAQIVVDDDTPYVVTTTNFDDFLQRAVIAFGRTPQLLDHPETALRVDARRREIQIVHLHGSFRGGSLVNTLEEILTAAQFSDASDATMARALTKLLDNDFSPIVIGYGGWRHDVVMTALRHKLGENTPRMLAHNLYWFLYRRSELRTLPPWLYKHPNVRFVVPGDAGAETFATLRAASSTREVVQVADPEGHDSVTLAADQVLQRVIKEVGIRRPRLLEDPLGYFADYLRGTLAAAGDPEVETVIRTVERARELHLEEIRRNDIAALERLRQEFTSAAMTLRPESVRDAGRDLLERSAELNEEDLSLLAHTGWAAASSLKDNSELELDNYALAARAAELWLERGYPGEAVPLLGLRAHIYAGSTRFDRGEYAAARPHFEAAARLFGRFDDPDFVQRVVRALRKLGLCHARLGDTVRATRALGEAIALSANNPSEGVRDQYALALYNRAVFFSQQQDPVASERDYRKLMDHFAKSERTVPRVLVIHASINRAILRAEAGFPADAANMLDAFIAPYSAATAPGGPTGRGAKPPEEATEHEVAQQRPDELIAHAMTLRDRYRREAGEGEP